MFTGLIQKVGRVEKLERADKGGAMTISHEPWEESLVPGESVAVQGACLTVTKIEAARFACDILSETLRLTTLSHVAAGDAVNLERALLPTDRLGGHFVTGHVDGVGHVAALDRAGRDWILRVECSTELIDQGIILKGSIAVNGVSLTVTSVTSGAFAVYLIPHTWENTSLRALHAGHAVNLETDMIGKYVAHFLSGSPTEPRATGEDDFRRAGFA